MGPEQERHSGVLLVPSFSSCPEQPGDFHMVSCSAERQIPKALQSSGCRLQHVAPEQLTWTQVSNEVVLGQPQGDSGR